MNISILQLFYIIEKLKCLSKQFFCTFINIKGRVFDNKSYSYIDSQISVHRKHEIIEQSGI